MHPSRRRKKRPNYGIRTVEVIRGPNGFGFTISGQQPCILSCIVTNSPADQAGLRAGDFLISVNGVSVSKIAHDSVVSLIGNCLGPIKMTIAENYYSDSSDEDLDCGRMLNARKPKYAHKPRNRIHKSDLRRAAVETTENKLSKMKENLLKQAAEQSKDGTVEDQLNVSNPLPMDDEAGPIEYKALVGYLGTIEMPKQLLPSSRLQTVCSCIRKLRQEKRVPTAVLMTILPTCLTLKNASNNILAIYPTNRVVYVGSTADRESRHFGLVTSAVCDKRFGNGNRQPDERKHNNSEAEVEISNSCHVFVVNPKLIEHAVHLKKAESFKITCTNDPVSGNCLEFPKNALYIVSLVQNMYKLQNNDTRDNLDHLVANSPQPSASSNSDSGIGFRDDCGNISDRIVVVEFPLHRPVLQLNNSNRPSGMDGGNGSLEGSDLPLNNVRFQNDLSLSKDDSLDKVSKKSSNLNNIRACEGINIKNQLEKESEYLAKQNNDSDTFLTRLNCRAMPDPSAKLNRGLSPTSAVSSDDNTRNGDPDTGQLFSERAVDVPLKSSPKKSYECLSLHSTNDELDFKSSVDNISVHSSKSLESSSLMGGIFKVPAFLEAKKSKKVSKMASSCDSLDKYNENIMNYKLSPKVYGLSKPNYSCEELNNLDTVEKYGYGSLQDIFGWGEAKARRNAAQSEPDVRITRNAENLCDHNGIAKCNGSDGPAAWATSFEKLLDDPTGLHAFAEFLKKEFSAENIYFWAACERYRRLPSPETRSSEAQRIYQRHLAPGAAEAVNVDSQGRQCAENGLREPEASLFDQAQKQIFNLMKFDSYPRFLKSDIYKRCLSGDWDKQQRNADAALSLQSPPSVPKLKKSLSNAEDRRRRSLLPWHRKNRSKSKDRGENEYGAGGGRDDKAGGFERKGESDRHSSHSSLTSLDLANQDPKRLDEITLNGNRTALCRILLSNGSTTVVQIRDSETIRQLIERLLEKRNLKYSSFEVFTNKHSKPLDTSESSAKLAGCEVTVERRVVFKLDLPNRKIISVKSKYTKVIVDVLRPILHKYQYSLDQVTVKNGNKAIDLRQPVTAIDEMRLQIQLREAVLEKSHIQPPVPLIRVDPTRSTCKKLDEITNMVFEGILQEKSDCVSLKFHKSDKGSVKSEDWGSEHSSGRFGKFIQERKKKTTSAKCKSNSSNASSEETSRDEQGQAKKPLITKLRAGAFKLHVACSESDELVEGLTRAQRSRLEDQRGTEINFELPDFLKDKEKERLQKPLLRTDQRSEPPSQFYLGETEKAPVAASGKNLKLEFHENRQVFLLKDSTMNASNSRIPVRSLAATNAAATNANCNANVNVSNVRSSLPRRSLVQEECSKIVFDEEDSKESKSSPSQRNLMPPPLPPKPKIVPIKPPNWGQVSGFYKSKDSTGSERALFLEQPSSSFV